MPIEDNYLDNKGIKEDDPVEVETLESGRKRTYIGFSIHLYKKFYEIWVPEQLEKEDIVIPIRRDTIEGIFSLKRRD